MKRYTERPLLMICILSIFLFVFRARGSTDAETGNGEGVPEIKNKVVPRVINKPAFYERGKRASDMPLPLPTRPENAYPTEFSNAFANFPDEPPFQSPPKISDSSNNFPVRSSSLKGLQPPSRWMHTAVLLQNKFVIWGGITNAAEALNDLWLFSYSDAEWTELERPMSATGRSFPNEGAGQSDHHDILGIENIGRPPSIPPPESMLPPPGTVRESYVDPSAFTHDTLKYVSIGVPPAIIPRVVDEERASVVSIEDVLPGGPAETSAFLQLANGVRSKPHLRVRGKSDSHRSSRIARVQRLVRVLSGGTDESLASDAKSEASLSALERFRSLRTSEKARGEKSGSKETADPNFGLPYGAGGNTLHAAARGDVWAYDVDTRTWSQPEKAPEEPDARWMHTAVVNAKDTAHSMVVFGGCSYKYELMNDVWQYKYPSSWEKMWPASAADAKTGPAAVEGHAASLGTKTKKDAALQEMYVFGGVNHTNLPSNEMWMFDIQKKKWTHKKITDTDPGSKPIERWLHTMVSVQGGTQLIVFGGCSATSSTLDDTWMYDVSGNSWELLEKENSYPPPGRWLHSSISLISGTTKPYTEYVVVFGGAANNIHMDDMWFFNVEDMVWFEDFAASDKPLAREGHTMTLVASPQMQKNIQTAGSSSTRRRLLTLFPFVQEGPIENGEKESTEVGMGPPWDEPKPLFQRTSGARAEDFVATERSSTGNFWLFVFGGRTERGMAMSASSSSLFV